VVLALAVLAGSAAPADPACAQSLEGSTFEQSGKLRFKFRNKYGNVEPAGEISAPTSTRIRYSAESAVILGPAEGLAADEFAMPIAFSEGLLLLIGTWSANSKGKVKLRGPAPRRPGSRPTAGSAGSSPRRGSGFASRGRGRSCSSEGAVKCFTARARLRA